MNKQQQQPDPNITIETNVTQEQLADDISVTALTGVMDITQTVFLDGRTLLIEKVFPFSIVGAVVTEEDDC